MIHSAGLTLMQNKCWGHQLLLDVDGCRNDLITDPTYLNTWVKDLVQKIDMVAYGEPQVVHFGEGEPHLSGWTVIQLIETSNIVAHFCDNSDQAYIDVFSCKPFDLDAACGQVLKWFQPTSMRTHFLTRNA
jgi:S-adenosylmethionine decarboxylase